MNGIVSEDLHLEIPGLTPAQSFQYSLSLQAYSGISASMMNNVPRRVTVSATSDFGHTLSINSIGFKDSSGNPLSDFSVQSNSGFDYNQFTGGSEPSTFLLIGVGSVH